MRVVGAGLLVLAGLLTGLQKAAGLQKDVERRGDLCRMLEGLAYELGRFRTPLPEVFSLLSDQCAGEAKTLCTAVRDGFSCSAPGAFSAIWENGLAAVPPTEREILVPLGSILGRYGTVEQLSALDRCRRDMEELFTLGQTRLREQGRVSVGLWTAAGLMTAVVLI